MMQGGSETHTKYVTDKKNMKDTPTCQRAGGTGKFKYKHGSLGNWKQICEWVEKVN